MVQRTERPAADFVQLAAPGVRGLHPYVPGKPIAELEREYGVTGAVKLASNENPLGPSPRALAAIGAALDEVARYPDGAGFDLKSALAHRHALDPETITLGNGSNDVLELVARAFLTPADDAVCSAHAFAVYPIVIRAIGATARVAPAHDGTCGPVYGHDLAAMRAAVSERTRLVFIANPNNPTGTWLPAGALRAFLHELPPQVLVVVDEAYFEYVDEPDYPDCSTWLAEEPRLIVTRTFSKVYGLAALRVGYALSHPGIADLLNRVRQPFNVNSLAQAAALAALQDMEHVRAGVQHNKREKAELERGLLELGLGCTESVGNFVCVNVGRPGLEVYEALLREGVVVRPLTGYGLPQHLRITVGLAEENRRCLTALARVLGR